MMDTKWWIEAALQRTKEVVSALAVIAAVLWFVAKPIVDSYIEAAIAGQGYAKQDALLNLNGKVFDASKSLKNLNDEQIKQGEQLRNIENNSLETQRLIRQFLLERNQPPAQ